jgi:phospholipid/cholesterol/gamma-HCH transport system substrate-binding protein
METRTPSLGKIVTMVLFALSCVGLLLFLWLSFGGTIPFKPQGYRVRISFPNADQLAAQADVRIAGVNVGKVVSKSLDPKASQTIATVELQSKFAPIRQDARAILRQKTIAGETYIELAPGPQGAPAIPDGGLLARGNVQPAVQLDQIFDTFDPTTRHAFQVWQRELAVAVQGNDQNLNSVFGNLPAFAANANDLLAVLDVEHAAVVNLVQNGGTTFAALSRDQGALRNLITSSGTTFATTAATNNALADTFRVFPTFLNEAKATNARLKTFALDTDPLIKQLEPVAQDLTPTLAAVRTLSPDLRRLFVNLGPLVTVSKAGLPAVRDVLVGAKPLLASLGPFLEQLNPILTWIEGHQQLTADFISQAATAFAAKTNLLLNTTGTGHYLRSFAPAILAGLGSSAPTASVRGNTYPPSLWVAPQAIGFSGGGKFPNSFAPPAFDCFNSKGPVPADPKTQTPTCWIAPPLPGAKPGQIPHILAATYPKK